MGQELKPLAIFAAVPLQNVYLATLIVLEVRILLNISPLNEPSTSALEVLLEFTN
ncbi:hypothetical protein [Pseudomonas brassicacearum]|uniref:hypothetical protein n=1 Tax=Pseudomonas brassicacearum TaxID=930166 RepID=UPI00160DDF4F|nr:hypothetical protein [Pseudomonas brassicacearum]